MNTNHLHLQVYKVALELHFFGFFFLFDCEAVGSALRSTREDLNELIYTVPKKLGASDL